MKHNYFTKKQIKEIKKSIKEIEKGEDMPTLTKIDDTEQFLKNLLLSNI